jgi:hypothetical protein
MEVCWNIAFFDNWQDAYQNNLINANWMQHEYKDRWFADPFILRITENEIVVLCEEYIYSTKKGRLAKLVIDRNNWKLKHTECVLELETHLSFPIIFTVNNELYIYPENGASDKLLLYKYDENINKIEEKAILCKDPLVDAVIVTQFDRPYIFALNYTKKNRYNVLDIYSSNKWNHQYEYNNSIIFNDKIARGAGDWFYLNNELIRPAQNCEKVYGGGLVFQEVLFKDGQFQFNEIKRCYPSSAVWNVGMHTFNIKEDILVIDGCRYKHAILAEFVKKLKKNVFKEGR